jgi:hypothetical protein
VHGDPGDIGRSDLDLAGVERGPQGDALSGRGVEQLGGAISAMSRARTPGTPRWGRWTAKLRLGKSPVT